MPEKITLLPMTRARMQALFRDFVFDPDLFSDPALFEKARNAGCGPAAADALFARRCREENSLSFAVTRDGAVIGEAVLRRIDPDRKDCELSIHLQNDAVKGRGFGTQAEKLALEQAFGVLGLRRVRAEVLPKNTRSRHVLEKLGFVRTAEKDGFLRYELDRPEAYGPAGSRRAVILQTPRLILRPFAESDADALYPLAADPAVGPAAGWPAHKSPEETRDVIRNVLSGPECCALCRREDGLAAGAVELRLHDRSRFAEGETECELGYWVGRPFWGQGLMPEAAGRLLRRAFEDLGMEKVWCGYYEGNEKSRRVQEKLGFVPARTEYDKDVPLLGEKRTEKINLMTRERWQTLRAAENKPAQQAAPAGEGE